MRIAFTDFYSGYQAHLTHNPVTKYFVESPEWEIVKPGDNPDLIIASVFGKEHTKYPDAHKLLWAAENMALGSMWRHIGSFEGVDWAFVDNHKEAVNIPESVKYYYLPYAPIHYDMEQIKRWHDKNVKRPKTKFCCFVSSGNGQGEGYPLRNNFFEFVNGKYKRVDSAGGNLNNMNGYRAPHGDAYIDWVADYKFMICFENSQGAGYLSEKIFTPYAAGTIPIYWGDKSNFNYVRKEACIFYTTPQETLYNLMFFDNSPTLYKDIVNRPLFYTPEELNGKEDVLSSNYIKKLLDEIVTEIKS